MTNATDSTGAGSQTSPRRASIQPAGGASVPAGQRIVRRDDRGRFAARQRAESFVSAEELVPDWKGIEERIAKAKVQRFIRNACVALGIAIICYMIAQFVRIPL